MDVLNLTKKIYSKMQDEESKEIYGNRCLFNMTGDKKYLIKMLYAADSPYVAVDRFINNNKDKKIYIYGAGARGKKIYKHFAEKCEGFIDKKIYELEGLSGVTPEEFFNEKIDDKAVIISLKNGGEAIADQLSKIGYESDSFLLTAKYWDKGLEYFENFMEHSDDEIFVDAGVYDGGSTLDFVKWTNGKYKKIYMFEPSKEYHERFFKNVKDLDNLEWVKKGLWSKTDSLKFFERSDSDISVEQNLNGVVGDYEYSGGQYQTIDVTSLDEYLGDEKVTFIKMDIEGSECEALKGAEKIIMKNKPKLAICIYHKLDDLWTIPEIIMNYRDDYKFYIRHYGMEALDTVLYAI